MSRQPVPQRIPPLRWRNPAILWTPAALAIAIGWPAVLFYNDAGLQELIVVAGAGVFAFALVTLGASWILGFAPRTRRTVVLHVVVAGFLASLVSPFALTRLLAVVADYQHAGAAVNFSISMSAAMAPLWLMLGLPVALVSGMLFAWIALMRRDVDAGNDVLGDHIFSRGVQPFR